MFMIITLCNNFMHVIILIDIITFHILLINMSENIIHSLIILDNNVNS